MTSARVVGLGLLGWCIAPDDAAAQGDFNSRGQWTAFKDIGEGLEARAQCVTWASPRYGRYRIQVKNPTGSTRNVDIQVSGVSSVDPPKRMTLAPRTVSVVHHTSQPCGNVQSQDIFISAVLVTAASPMHQEPVPHARPNQRLLLAARR